jgi:hypothetical protein
MARLISVDTSRCLLRLAWLSGNALTSEGTESGRPETAH